MSEELLERLGQLIDRCDNNLSAATLPLSAYIHVAGLTAGMRDVRAELFAIYTEAGGENVWEEQHEAAK